MSIHTDKRFFGREAELARFEVARRSVLGGNGRTLLVSGDPGIGKSALVNHFGERLKESSWQVFSGNSFEGEFTPPGWLWIQIVREALDTYVGKEAFALLSSAHRSAVELLLPEIVREQTPTATASIGVESRFEIFDSITRYISILSRSNPVMLWVEDLHWAGEFDTALWDFISQQTSSEKVLVVATSRSKNPDPESAWGSMMRSVSRLPGYEHLRLGKLDRESMTDLVESLSSDQLPIEQVTERVDRADGSPLFGRELARMPFDSNNLPSEISFAILSRISDFDDQQIDLLRSAALFGRGFKAMELAQIHNLPLKPVNETLKALENRAIVERESPGSEEFRFTHPLIIETLVQPLSTDFKSKRHAQIGKSLIELYGESDPDQVSTIGQHCRLGYEHLNRNLVIAQVLMAGDRAAGSFAYTQAADLYLWVSRNLEPEGDSEDRAATLERLGSAVLNTHLTDKQPGWNLLSQSVEMYLRLGLNQRAVKAASFPAVLGGITGVVDVIESALKVANEGTIEHGRLLARYIVTLNDLAKFEEAEQAYEQALKIAGDSNDGALNARVLIYGSQISYRSNDPEKCAERGLKAISAALEVGDKHSISRILNFTVESLCATGRIIDAKELVARCRRLLDPSAHPVASSIIGMASYWIAKCEGDWDAMASVLQRIPDTGWLDQHKAWFEASELYRKGERNEVLLNSLDPSFSKWRVDALHIAADLASTWLLVNDDQILLRYCKDILEKGLSESNPTVDVEVRIATLGVLIAIAERTVPPVGDVDSIQANTGFMLPRSTVPRDRVLALVAAANSDYSLAKQLAYSSINTCREFGFNPALAWSLFDVLRLAHLNPENVSIDEVETAAAECLNICDELEMPALAHLVRSSLSQLRASEMHGLPGGLSKRELDVLLLIAEGKSNPEIAEALFISRHTVVRHVTNIFSKIDCSSRAEAATFAVANGLAGKN